MANFQTTNVMLPNTELEGGVSTTDCHEPALAGQQTMSLSQIINFSNSLITERG